MFDKQAISAAITSATQTRFSLGTAAHIGGGDINQAYRIEGHDGRRFFLKLNQVGQGAMFEAEAEGLAELASAQAIRVPDVICYGETANHSYLVIEYIALGGITGRTGKQMGQQLAALHQTCSDNRQYGWHRDNTIGLTPQQNPWTPVWVDFLRQHRLGFQLDLAAQRGAGQQLINKGRSLLDGLDYFFDAYQPEPALLHGDLWAGNAACDEAGMPVIYDPAVYFGDRETDIAMTELFGGFSNEFYIAYAQKWPLDAGYTQRRDLYKLYHILNHFNMFGGGYISQAENIIERLLNSLP